MRDRLSGKGVCRVGRFCPRRVAERNQWQGSTNEMNDASAVLRGTVWGMREMDGERVSEWL